MFLKILKKDIKRNKTMNLILFLFIILATVFVSSGLNNLISVLNGTDYYLDTAGVGDYFAITLCGKDDTKVKEVLDKGDGIKSYKMDRILIGSEDVENDKKERFKTNSYMMQSIEDSKIKFYDINNKVINSVEKGHIYVTRNFLATNGFKEGDKIYLTFKGYKKAFIVDGKAKDAFLGSNFMGNTRFLLNDEDMEDLYSQPESDNFEGRVIYIETDDANAVRGVISNIDKVQFSESRKIIILTYILDMIIAFVIVILSICLIIVSFVILKFSIGFTIQDDYREIGVMKAIGIRNRKIRSLYMVKYIAIAAVGALVGLFISFPFGNMLMKSVTENMVLGNNYGKYLNILGACLVFLVIVGLSYLSTGKLKKMTLVDAIRSGEIGERFRKKRGIRISRSHAKNYLYLAWNDIVSSPKRFLNIIISFTLCTLFVLILSNTTASMDSNVFIDALATRADLYLKSEKVNGIDPTELGLPEDTDKIEFFNFMFREDGRADYEKYLKMLEDYLKTEGFDCKVSNEITYTYKIRFNGAEYSYKMLQPLDPSTPDYPVKEGSFPQNKNEIMITPAVADSIGAKIGDTVEIDFGTSLEKCTISGIYESMNNLGQMIKLHSDAPTSFKYATYSSHKHIYFNDSPSEKELQRRKEKLREIYGEEDVIDQRDLCVSEMNALDTIKKVEYLLLIITIIVILLVTVMMERTFISDEKKQIAILKAVGFRDIEVMKWQIMRFTLLAVISGVIAAILSIPVTPVALKPIFGNLGLSHFDVVYNFISLAKYPIIIVGCTVFFAGLTALHSRKIKARDTASIE